MNAMVGKSVDALEFEVRDWSGLNPAHGAISPAGLKGRIVVLDFWATGNTLSVDAIPTFNRVLNEYEEAGVEVIGIAAERGSERMAQVIESSGMRYVTGRDTFRATAGAYGLQWRPWTVIVDRLGIVRAAGIRPEFVGDALEMILKEQPAPSGKEFTPKTRRVKASEGESPSETDGEGVVDATDITPVPQEWMEASYARYETLKPMIDKMAPELEVETWRNSFERRLRELRGKVVLLYFWSIDNERCLTMAKLLDELQQKHEADGLVVIGITDRVSGDDLTAFLREHNIGFPVCIDPFRATINKYEVDGFPDVYFVGKRGRLRGADIKAQFIPEMVEMLLNESP
jgi:peroxiredoxin